MKSIFSIFIFIGLWSVSLVAQEDRTAALLTPYDAVYQHLHYLQPESYQPQESAITIQKKTGKAAQKIAIQIKQILDADNLYVIMSSLPKDSLHKDSTGYFRYYLFPKKQPHIYLERKAGKWYYSKETIEITPKLHRELYPWGSAKLLNYLPKMGTGRFLGLMVWQYYGLLLFIGFGFLSYFVFRKIVSFFLRSLAKKNLGEWQDDTNLIRKIVRFLCLVIIVSLMRLFLPVLQLPVEVNSFVSLVLDILKYIFYMYLALRVFDVVMIFLRRATRKTTSNLDDQLLKIIRSAVQVGIITFGIITILNRLDVNVAALIAGVSIGGLAIALAAQDSVKNLIGAFMIFFDKPFDVGDYIVYGNVRGVVTEVGFRSTRIQSLDTSMISIPNGKIADDVVNNMGRRVYRRYRTALGVKYDTPPDTIALFVEGVKRVLELNEEVADEKTLVYLNDFGASSLDILLVAYFRVQTWGEELQGRQTVMLGILRLADTLGVEFAFPSQSVYMEKMDVSQGEKVVNKDTLDTFIEKYKKTL